MSEVPVYGGDGRLMAWVAADWCERNAGNLRIVRNRRGHLKRAYLRADDGELVQWLEQTGRLSSFGFAFEQQLSCGRVWSLRGVRGSGR